MHGPLPDRCLLAVQAAATTLGNLAASPLGCTLLLKTSLLSDAQQLLHQLLQRRDGQRLAALLEVLANAAAQPEGLKQMLKTQDAPGVARWSVNATCVVLHEPWAWSGATLAITSLCETGTLQSANELPSAVMHVSAGLLDLVLSAADSRHAAASTAALFLLRNLAFLPGNKAHFVSNPRALPLLVKAALHTEGAPEKAALAASALWALMHQGERVRPFLADELVRQVLAFPSAHQRPSCQRLAAVMI